jgi:hypothetical protein
LRDNADIYFVLLGLVGGRRPPDHYTLLGLPPLTDSQRQINAAVERQMAKLTPLLLSPQGRQAQRIIGEVLEARDVLSSESRKRAYDADLIRGIEPDANAETRAMDIRDLADASPPAAPRGNRPKANIAPQKAGTPKATPFDVEAMLPPPASEPLRPAITPPPAPPAQPAAAVSPPIAAEFIPIPLITPPSPFAQVAQHRFAPMAKDVSLSEMALDFLQPRTASDEPDDGPFVASQPAPSTAPAPTSIFAPIVEPDPQFIPTAIPVSPFTPFDQPVESRLPAPVAGEAHEWPRPSDGAGLASVARSAGVVVPRRTDRSQGMLIAIASVVGVAALVACLGIIANQRQTARTAQSSTSAPTSPAATHTTAQSPNPKSQNSPQPKLPATAPKELAPPTTPPSPPVGTTPIISPPTTSEPPESTPPPDADPPKPEPKTPGPDPEPTPAPAADPKELKAVTAALTAARTALEKRDVEGAGKQLDLALLEATNAALIAKIENEQALHHYVDGFWGAVRERIKGLQGGEELAVGNQVVIVVERRGDRIVIRDRGANKTVGPRDMPAPIAAALAESWLKKDDPNSAVFLGAFWSVDAKGNEKRGRQILEDAKQNGAEAAAGVLEALGPAKQPPK